MKTYIKFIINLFNASFLKVFLIFFLVIIITNILEQVESRGCPPTVVKTRLIPPYQRRPFHVAKISKFLSQMAATSCRRGPL